MQIPRVLALALLTVLAPVGLLACSDDGDEVDTGDTTSESTEATSDDTTGDTTGDDTDATSAPDTDAGTDTTLGAEPVETTVPDSVASPTTRAPAPEELGVPSEYGMEYPDGTTCAEAEAAFAVMGQDTLITLAETGGTWIWLAIDEPSASADLFSAPDRTLVRIRGGEIAFEGEPDVADLPALGGDVSYATLTSDTENGITDCVDGPVVD